MKQGTICRNCKSQSEEIRIIKSEIKIKDKLIELEAQRKVCTNCNQIKFDKVLDQEFSLLAIKKYNQLYGINGEEIVALRKEFGISQETLGKVLGIAKKTIVAYENEKTIPNDSYYTLIKSVLEDKSKLLDFASINKDSLSEYEKRKLFEGKASLLILNCDPFEFILKEEATPYTGYQVSSKEKIIKFIQYIASRINGKTKLAKTLFFADALAYSETATSLSGIQYAAINNGPIPDQFDYILDYMINAKKLRLEIEEVSNYTQYNYHPLNEVDLDESDKIYLDKAIDFTINKTAACLSEITHKLDIWKNANTGDIMSFDLLDNFSLDDL